MTGSNKMMSANRQLSLQRIISPILFVLVTISLATFIYLFGPLKVFAFFGIDAMTPYFADLRQIAAAVDAEDRGLKPWLENPGDPWDRPLNYPVIWIWLFRRIANWGDPVLIFGMAQLVAFFGLGLWLSCQKEGYLAFLLCLSPPILLAIERGSTNILVFLLMLFGVWRASIPGGVALGLATALKFFPAAAMGIVAFRANYRFLIGVALVAPLIVWAFIQLPRIYDLFPSSPERLFGVKSFSRGLYALFGPGRIPRAATSAYAVYSVFFVMTCLIWHIFRPNFEELFKAFCVLGKVPKRFALAFLATFVGMFLTASNQIYMLLFFSPILVVLLKVVQFNGNRLALIILIMGLAIFFLPLFPYWGKLISPAVFAYAILVTPILIEASRIEFAAKRSITLA